MSGKGARHSFTRPEILHKIVNLLNNEQPAVALCSPKENLIDYLTLIARLDDKRLHLKTFAEHPGLAVELNNEAQRQMPPPYAGKLNGNLYKKFIIIYRNFILAANATTVGIIIGVHNLKQQPPDIRLAQLANWLELVIGPTQLIKAKMLKH